ncbi:Uncharacterized protein DAT39_019899, partial [Clarias magur]
QEVVSCQSLMRMMDFLLLLLRLSERVSVTELTRSELMFCSAAALRPDNTSDRSRKLR